MDLDRIRALIDAMATSDLAEMEFSEDGWTLRLARRASNTPASPRAPRPARATVARPTGGDDSRRRDEPIVSPLFGVVYLRPNPDAADFVAPGMAVKAGTTLCVVEAMKVFNEIKAERDGVVTDILVSTGAEVEFGQELIRLE
jgi:acetyl-CoA carboxylase biotin carboxyl carrier protein